MQHKEMTEKLSVELIEYTTRWALAFFNQSMRTPLIIELSKNGLKAEQQKEIKVYYESEEVVVFTADIIVENTVIIEGEIDKTPYTST